ncbi:ABC transporter ATP-binding protein [Bacillus aquiflavi]|uniref:ABC transporter ATP-binding protein n=1 Tax=Bacillus aquiflavi TaxID=2672567 RepID=A0A6B3VT13_9BACI|nr:ABC transporter ATP-binding protein [Bacillus aquiflavi]MBA4535985.1 ABC transporter ATP-binding protein [Bacillus aquiflavi]NEY80358.1 ABC transporter ATP-binding protein [Bacillus aquiflavi]UAC47724.1 ABC transporter ATP-binding protein [Bacillus aquiflavi]
MTLHLNNLVKKYGKLTVLDGISATFEEGQCYLLLGENGAGKSTLAKCIAGDEEYDNGSIYLDHSSLNLHEMVALQYQSFDSFPHLKVREVIQLFQRLIVNPFDVEELYELLGITSFENILMKNTSGGQRKAVSIILAFLLNKPIILLDEPFADLDLTKKKQFLYFLKMQLQQENKLFILISHEVAGFEELFDYIYILKNGRIVEQGKRDELKMKYQNTIFPGIEGIYFEVTGQLLGGKVG